MIPVSRTYSQILTALRNKKDPAQKGGAIFGGDERI